MNIKLLLSKGKTIYELPLRVTYYARVSTDHLEQVTSLVNQVDYFTHYIARFSNWKMISGYLDEGISGKAVRKRENFLRMIEEGKKGCFDLILTKSVSRFARNTMDSLYYTELLLKHGVGVIFLNDNINTFYSDSEFRLTLMASIAQDELRKLSESVKFGLGQSIKRGVVLGNNNILGYNKSYGKLVICPEEALIIRNIFLWFVTGKYNYREISEMVFSRFQKKIDSSGIRRILMNYKYKGYYCGGKSRVVDYKKSTREKIAEEEWIIYQDYDKVPPIIGEKIWNKVQEIIGKRGKKKAIYDRKLYCLRHHQYFIHKQKKYKDRLYSYYLCPKCCSFKEELLERIYKQCPFFKIVISPLEGEYLFKVFMM